MSKHLLLKEYLIYDYESVLVVIESYAVSHVHEFCRKYKLFFFFLMFSVHLRRADFVVF